MAADIEAINTGDAYYYNGECVLNYGAKSTYDYMSDNQTSGLIADISGEYDDRFDDITYYTTGS